MLIEYVKNNKNERIGCLVAKKDSEMGKVYIGWSKFHSSLEEEPFDKKFAVYLASSRIAKQQEIDLSIIYHATKLIELSDVKNIQITPPDTAKSKERNIPFAIQRVLNKFYDRCHRYYKTDSIEVI